MPPLGAHMSISGGLYRALERGAETGCEAVQIFSRSNQQWAIRPIPAGHLDLWRAARKRTGQFPAMVHGCYLVNLAGADPTLWSRSCAILAEEYRRCALLDIPYLVIHPGAHMGQGETAGLLRIATALNWLHEQQPDNPTRLLLENTAGQGSSIGHSFSHLRDLLGLVAQPDRLGVCIDTCHTLAAGYDISTERGWERTFAEFHKTIGIKWIRAFHVNDSKTPVGSRVDRHQHIGLGFVGLTGFRCLVNDPRFKKIPMTLETPKPRADSDLINLAVLRGLFGKKRVPAAVRALLARHAGRPTSASRQTKTRLSPRRKG